MCEHTFSPLIKEIKRSEDPNTMIEEITVIFCTKCLKSYTITYNSSDPYIIFEQLSVSRL